MGLFFYLWYWELIVKVKSNYGQSIDLIFKNNDPIIIGSCRPALKSLETSESVDTVAKI